jgi:hypothetical protein
MLYRGKQVGVEQLHNHAGRYSFFCGEISGKENLTGELSQHLLTPDHHCHHDEYLVFMALWPFMIQN